MKIVFLPADLDGSGCYRCIFPMSYLAQRGHETSIPAFVLQDHAGNLVQPGPAPGLGAVPPGDFIVSFFADTVPDDADVYVVGMGKLKWQLECARELKARGARIVVDMDDDLRLIPLYNPGQFESTRAMRDRGGFQMTNLDANPKFAEECIEMADAVTTTTDSLAEIYSRFNANVHVLPNKLHWPMWAELAPVYERKDWSRLRVGYMGGYDFHNEDVKTISKELRMWLRRNPDVEFVAAGDHRFHDLIGVPEAQRATTARIWFRNLDLAYTTSTFDIGLIPLVKNRFNEGKSYLKGLEYSACGIVPLASPTQPYRDFIRDGESGFLCDSPRAFVDRLDELKADGGLLGRMGRAAHASASANTLDQHVSAWEDVYAGLIGDSDNSVLAGTREAA